MRERENFCFLAGGESFRFAPREDSAWWSAIAGEYR